MSNTIRKRKKLKRPGKRFDNTNMAKALEDMGFVRGFFSCLGIVQPADDGGTHFDLDGEDLTVEVELMPSQTRLTVRVGTVAGGGGGGIWKVPPVDAEVLVAIPDGDIDFQPTICSWYAGGNLPDDISETTMVISCPAGGKVYIHDGSGAVEPLVRQSAFENHIHPTGVGPSSIPDTASIGLTPYTTVLESK